MAPLTEPAFARLRSVDPVLAEAAGDAAFELETDLFAALAKGIMEKGASDAFPFAWASLAAQIGEVSPERVLEAGSALEAFGKKTANALLGAAKAVRSGKIGMERLAALPDDEAVGALCSLRCVDVRLAVRVLIGVLRRPDVLRFDDEAVRSGLMRVHGPRSCTQEGFEAFRARHAPFGSAATLIAAMLTARCRSRMLSPLAPVLVNAVVVGAVLYFVYYSGSAVPMWLPMAQVGLGQFVACYGLGLPLLGFLEKRFPSWREREGEQEGCALKGEGKA